MKIQDLLILKIGWLLAALALAADDLHYIQVGTYSVDQSNTELHSVQSEDECKRQCVTQGTAMFGVGIQYQNVINCLCTDEISRSNSMQLADNDNVYLKTYYASTASLNLSFYHREDFSHVGCFMADNEDDQWPQFDSWIELNDSYYDIDRDCCLAQCSIEKFRYAGLLDGNRCLCFNNYGALGQSLPAGQCDSPCNANDRQVCGGENKLQIFEKSSHLMCQPLTSGLSNNIGIISIVQRRQCLLAGDDQGSLMKYVLKGHERLCYSDPNPNDRRVERVDDGEQDCDQSATEEEEDERVQAMNSNTAYVYLGCFIQNVSSQLTLDETSDDRPTYDYSPTVMDVETCILHCDRNHLPYAGLTEGISCFCGQTILNPELVTTPNKCNMTCSRNWESEIACGGRHAMDIFFIKIHEHPVSKTDSDMGEYVFSGKIRA